MSSENRNLCAAYLKKCRGAGKIVSGFPEALTMLQTEVSATGLNEKELKLLLSIITRLPLNSTQRTALIKCLIPERKMPDNIVEKMGVWFMSTAKNIQVMAGIAVVHWFIGLMDYGLVEMKTVNTFYHPFFYILVKNQKLEPYLAHLIYVLTKPDDVSRSQVSKILTLQTQYANPKKHLNALLSLFKSYKPQHVPESIPSTNVESAWKRIPEALRLDLQDAAKRLSNDQQAATLQQNFVWNPVTGGAKSAKKHHSIIPMVGYINIGSSISRDINMKSIFEIRTLEELGKHQLSIELPCNALSLLANTAGLHILTFAPTAYQSRFSYNLYNTLQNAFIFEVDKYSYEERERLITMTVELSRYMQQEIILVTRFLHNYLPFWNTIDHREGILGLLEWISFPSFIDIYNNILMPLQTMWECSSVNIKCDILSTFKNLITNLFIKQGFAESRTTEPPLFLGNSQTLDLAEILEPLMNFINNLIVSGLYVETSSSMLLSAALSLYEKIAMLEESSDLLLWTIAPPAVVYGGFASKSIATVSRVCSLLLQYRDINAKLKQMRSRDLFEAKIKTLDTYAKDLAKGLWYNEVFRGPKDAYFLRHIPESVLMDFKNSCSMETALNISNHFAVLPYKFTLIDLGLDIQTAEDCLSVADTYYPEVAKFLRIFRG